MVTIFISYSRSDSAFVDRLEADLQQQGYRPWVDRHALEAGSKWRRELQEAVEGARVLLVVLSSQAIASEYVQREYGYALDEGKTVIPLYYRPCKVPWDLRGIQGIAFEQSYEQGLAALLATLRQEEQQASSSSSESEPEGGWAEHLWNVPYPRNPVFTGRARLLEQLHARLGREQSAALGQLQALTGLGGIGKTQTAIEYAHRYRDEYTAVFWIKAASRETLVADFVALARLLNLPSQDAPEQMQVVEAVKHWLEQHAGWLLILDNADDLTLLADFLPTGDKGYFLLTTRTQATGRIAASLPVEKLEMSEGLLLLLRRAKLLAPSEPIDNASSALRTPAQALVAELDGLPLAIDQAGAYIEETGGSVADYLTLYQRRRADLLKRHSNVTSDYPYTVASTWSISFEQVEQVNPAATDLLRLCAFLAPDAIPEEIIIAGAAGLGSMLAAVAADALLLNEAIQTLRHYSLVKRDAEEKLLYLHRLVQVVLKDAMPDDTQRLWAERTVRAVNAAFPEVSFAVWNRCQRCLPHVGACASLIEQHGFTFPEAARLLDCAGWYLCERGLYMQAESLLQQALIIHEQLGPEHPDTATTLAHLAELQSRQGKYEQAEPLFQRALAIREQQLGLEHPETADILNDLAWLYVEQSRYAQAEPLFKRALAIRERALGPDHPDVGESLNDLAVLYNQQGKYEQAEPLFQRALGLIEQARGPEHPVIATTIENLATNYNLQGKYKQAEPLYQRALVIREQKLGPEHPDTAITLCDLARCNTLQGKYAQAEPLFQRALAIFEKVFSPQHPNVAFTLNYLAELYQAQGRYEQAEPLNLRALAICEQALGPEHPRAATILDNLAHLYFLQGQYEQAEPLYRRALAIREQKLGPSHPFVGQSLHHLAQLYQAQGKYEQARPLLQHALTISEQALGREHPDTIKVREDYAKLAPYTIASSSGIETPE